ncbi:hypothetical protein ACP70R_043126 [Stipagrostis hirtigluma subsp. patula]
MKEVIDPNDASMTKTILVPNSEYATWLAEDQHLLSFLNSSMSWEVLAQVAHLTSSAQVWAAVQAMYSSQSHARIVHLLEKLSTALKGNMSSTAYFTKMTGFADEMVATGKKIDDEDLITYILSGLHAEFNPFVESVCGRVETISMRNLYAQLLFVDATLEVQNNAQQYHMSANFASHGKGGKGGREGGRGRDGGCIDGFGHGKGGYGGKNSDDKTVCQLCNKVGHIMRCYYKYFDVSYGGEEKVARSAVALYGVDTNWYI